MAFHGNKFALLGGDDADDVENLISRFAASATEADEPPSSVEKRKGKSKKPLASSRPPSVVEERKGNSKKPLASSQAQPPSVVEEREGNREKPLASFRLSSQFSSKPQRFFDHGRSERGRDKGHGLERRNGNDLERNNQNGVKRYHGQESVNNRGASNFKRNNGYRHDERPNDSSKRNNVYRPNDSLQRNNGYSHDERHNDSSKQKQNEERHNGEEHKEEEVTNGDGWQVVVGRRPNGREQSSVGESNRNYGCRREFRGDNGNWSDVKVFKDKQHQEGREQDGVSGGFSEKSTEANVDKDDKEYRIRKSNSGGNNRFNRGFNRGNGHGGAGEGGERRGNRGGYQGNRHAIAAEGKDNGKTSESMEEQKDSGEANAGSKGDDAIAAEASKESESKRGMHDQVLSREEAERIKAERELEAKRMTLREYEKKLQEKRKVLESMNAQERRIVTLDKDFESMHIIEKKNQETIFVKLNSDNDKLKKKVTMDKNDNNVQKINNFKIAGSNYSRRRSGRYTGHEEKGNIGGDSGRREGTGNNPVNVRGVKKAPEDVKEREKKAEGTPPSPEDAKQSAKKAAGAPPSPEDAKEFPALAPAKEFPAIAPIGSTKE